MSGMRSGRAGVDCRMLISFCFRFVFQVKLVVTWACSLAAVSLPSLSLSTSLFICAAPETRKSLNIQGIAQVAQAHVMTTGLASLWQ